MNQVSKPIKFTYSYFYTSSFNWLAGFLIELTLKRLTSAYDNLAFVSKSFFIQLITG